ncbi:MAG TPA: Xaa-Pro aminopeptidase [Balneola sp.]|jgi:Xaa-Pro dipeptidase|nr:Xaa-Pro aminopeptidase [Balneola sp.]MAO77347.1 Xaa-Pro aminopeptidase [Balneola sp.]MBF65305.1 Xaa-Pro aminopeptidase [Balneola sp.]HAH52452.1 Xaa-Pro aminopeptidase [Balneola sp.]HBZ38674.1 Xaa-Pro aminopeptidase [Balneola sp.]|tara:strand:+ start:2048 stop:3382 length:1335 start_codon:yes stop_codon:yes gene_type:complete
MHNQHREKLFSLFDDNQNGVVFIQGAETMYRYGTDYEFPFRQESNFWYLTGVNEADCSLILDLKKEEYHLFVPERDAQYAVWHGYVKTREQYQEEYQPDHLHYQNDILTVLNELTPETVYCIDDEQAEFVEDLDREFNVETEALVDALTYCRVLKTDWELDQMREACRVNDLAYLEVMKSIKPGMYEYEMKAIFNKVQIENGLLQDAYNGIFASGVNASILHYVVNNSKIKDGDLFLMDSGFECNGYAADYTRTFPANGTYTDIQKGIYNSVLTGMDKVLKEIKPGVKMEDLHLLAARTMMEGLKDMDIVKGNIDDIMNENIFALFFPHGLGHFLGLDTHDVGGYPKGVDRIDRPGIKFLRARRELLPGMVVTIEPGIYFVPAVLKPAIADPEKNQFLNTDKVESLLDFGGVRIEDDIIVTDDGLENMTNVPKEVDEIENLMAN